VVSGIGFESAAQLKQLARHFRVSEVPGDFEEHVQGEMDLRAE